MRVGIVGCSIVGGHLAWKLAQEGNEVSVFERKPTVGNKPCSGLVSERLWRFIPRDDRLIETEISSVKIHFPKKTISVPFRRKMFAVNRHGLDCYAARLAKEAGAEISLGAPVEKIDAEQAKIFSKGKEFQFDLIVGCDGANSITRKSLGLPEPKYRAGLYIYSSERTAENFVDVWPTENGFIWKIPRTDHAEYGIIDNPKTAVHMFEKFVQKNRIKKSEIYSALIPEGPIVSNSAKVLLCGDAAGLTKSWSGGGIVWGLTAADNLVKNLGAPEKYNRFVKVFFGTKIFLARTQTKLVKKFGKLLPKDFPLAFDPDFGML